MTKKGKEKRQEKEQYLYNKDTQDGFFPQSVSETAKGFKKKEQAESPRFSKHYLEDDG